MIGANVRADAWLRRFHPAPTSGVGLICLPHAGGSASYFFSLSKALSPALEVIAVQYPGRQDRRTEKPIDDLKIMADQISDVMQSLSDRPLVLFGHSMGAVLGFEVARRLEREGSCDLLGLIASGRRAPSTTPRRHDDIHLRDDSEMIAEIRALSGTDMNVLVDEELLRLILPALRSDYKAIETYRNQKDSRLHCPISVFVGDSDHRVRRDDALSWKEHTTGSFRFRSFPGGHFYLNSHETEVADAMTDHIGRFFAERHRLDVP